MTNRNLTTGIAYGYIAANSLDSDLVNDLQMGGDDVDYEPAKVEFRKELARRPEVQAEAMEPEAREVMDEDDRYRTTLQYINENWEGSDWEQEFNDHYQPDEPIHEGEKDGVKYRTSWLGGALNVWVFESPHTGRFRACSPCVPGAANLNNPDPDGIDGYDVPSDWRDEA